MKLVENADGLMQKAEKLFQDHQSNMRSDDRSLSEDRIINAKDFRDGIERKPWPNRAEQARLYHEQAQAALDAVKVRALCCLLYQGTDHWAHRKP